MAQNPASSTVCASTEARPSCSCGTESGNPRLRLRCPRHVRESTASDISPDNHDHLVQVPSFGPSWPPTLNPPRICPAEFQDPSSNCLIREVETTLGKQVLNVPIAQRETAIQPDGMLDDDRRKAVTTVRYLAHSETLKHRPCRSHGVNVIMPGGARLCRVLAARPREGRGRVDPGGSRLQLQALAQAEPGGVRRLDEARRDRGRAPTPRSATKPANGLYREETSANSARCQNHRRQIHIQSMTQSPTDC